MKDQYIENLEGGTEINSDFAVTSQSFPMKYKNKSGMWFSLEVSDKTGRISVKYWGGPDEDVVKILFNSFTVGDIITIKGKAQFDNYENALVISIDVKSGNSLQKSNTFDVADFLPITKKNIDDMVSQLKKNIEEVQDSNVKRLIKSFFDDSSFMEKYSKIPAAASYHHSYVGGLIEHVLNMIELSKVVAKQYEENLDVNLMIAGCIFHDIGKIEELEMKSSITYSVTGNLLGHISIGAHMVQTKINSLEEFPEILKNKIIHLILSHHGSLEFGSPVEPMFPEAIALNRIDECDSKVKRAIQLKHESGSKGDDEFVYIRNFGKMYLK